MPTSYANASISLLPSKTFQAVPRITSANAAHHIRQFAASYPRHAFRQFPASYQHYAFRHFSVLNSLQKNEGELFIPHNTMKSPPKILISSTNSCHLTDFTSPLGKSFKCNTLSPVYKILM
jgi:hypothetical protein